MSKLFVKVFAFAPVSKISGCQEILSIGVKKRSKNSKALYIKYIIFAIWVVAIIFGYNTHGIHRIDLAYGMSDITIERKIIL